MKRGISLLEVLISIFVLSIGLLGVLSLIPLGKINLDKVEISDRTGTVGRAILRHIKIANWITYEKWIYSGTSLTGNEELQHDFVIDQIGIDKGLPNNCGPVPRCSLYNINSNTFTYQDDIVFDYGDKNQRPISLNTYNGRFSYLLSVNFADSEKLIYHSQEKYWSPTKLNTRNYYTVSVIVCNRRNCIDGEHTTNITTINPGIGGFSIETTDIIPSIKKDNWIMLCGCKAYPDSPTQKTWKLYYTNIWYRVVFINRNVIELLGKPFDYSLSQVITFFDDSKKEVETPIILFTIDDVTGVYTEIILKESVYK